MKAIRVLNIKSLTLKHILQLTEKHSSIKANVLEYEQYKSPDREWS